MVRFRQAFLIIASICILIIGIQHGVVINAFKDWQSGVALSIKENVRSTLDASIIAGIIMEVVFLLAMIFLFVDKNAKHKFLGIGYLAFGGFVTGFTYSVKSQLWSCLNRAPNVNGNLIIDPNFDVGNMTGLSKSCLGFAIFLFIIVVIGIVSGEMELKRQKTE